MSFQSVMRAYVTKVDDHSNEKALLRSVDDINAPYTERLRFHETCRGGKEKGRERGKRKEERQKEQRERK